MGVGWWGSGAEEVAVEDAGETGVAEEDEGVGVGEEPGFYRGGEGLEGLGVVVLDEGLPFSLDWDLERKDGEGRGQGEGTYNSALRMELHKRSIKDPP